MSVATTMVAPPLIKLALPASGRRTGKLRPLVALISVVLSLAPSISISVTGAANKFILRA